MATTTVKRASTFAPGIGKNLDAILGTDVIVTKVTLTERSFAGEPSAIAIIELDNGEVYHAWSESLCEKLSQIPVEEFPLTFKFVRVPTRTAGQTVLTFE